MQIQVNHREHGGHGGKTDSQRMYAALNRIHSLTQCIIFISFMNFMVKMAVLCVLCALCGEKMYLFRVISCVSW